jgi:hypothetical protein
VGGTLIVASLVATSSLISRLLQSSFFFLVGGIFLYEGIAILTGLTPTISRIMAYNLDIHPAPVAAFEGFLAGIVIVMLALHFAGLLSFWKP